jgi:hypothetical protein
MRSVSVLPSLSKNVGKFSQNRLRQFPDTPFPIYCSLVVVVVVVVVIIIIIIIKKLKEKFGSYTRNTFDRLTTKDSYTWNITHNMESTAV